MHTYSSKISKKVLDLIISSIAAQATNKDLPVPRFGLFGINFLIVYCVFASRHHFVYGLWILEHDEGEPSRPACVGICLDIDIVNLAI